MQTGSRVETSKGQGPSGFMTINQNLLVVDYGNIYQDGTPVGFLHEDGLIEGFAAPFDGWKAMKTIEELQDCTFQGIDSSGVPVQLPSPKRGPTGAMQYNGQPLNVLYGRVCTQGHKVVGSFEDDGTLYLRDHKTPTVLHKMDETTQLQTIFQGIKSNGSPMVQDWIRPLHIKGKTYSDNEIIRYMYLDFDKLNMVEKQYVLETMKLWARSGLLQIVRKSQGDAALGNVKHGASGVTAVRSGNVTLDRSEFEMEIKLYKQFGPLAKIQPRGLRSHLEVRLNLVVSHEFGHQLEFTSSQACQDRVGTIYRGLADRSSRMYPSPEGYEGKSELLQMHQIENRVFISGYARSTHHEYWAESVAAFSVKESREVIKQMDKPIYDILSEIVFSPEKTLSPTFEQDALRLQTSLRVGGELRDDLLDT